MILTKEQAQAVYSAMCALDSIGAKLNASLYERAQLIRVHEAGGFIRVEVGGLQHEVFESQSAFAAAYELLEPSASHLDALETIASGNTDPDRMVELAREALAAIPAKTPADLLRTAVQTKIDHWDAIRAVETHLGDELTAFQDEKLCQAIESFAASVETGADISDENAPKVFDDIANTYRRSVK